MLQNLTGWHALIVLAIILLVFGTAKLPALAKSVGESVRILKSEVTDTGTASAGSALAAGATAPPVDSHREGPTAAEATSRPAPGRGTNESGRAALRDAS